MAKLSKEQLTNNIDLVKVFLKNEQGDDAYDALKKANYLTRSSLPNNEEVAVSKNPEFEKHPEWNILPYKLPDANLMIDIYISNNAYRKSFPDDNTDSSMYYSRVVDFEEIFQWGDLVNGSSAELYLAIHGLKKNNDSDTMIVNVNMFTEIYNAVFPKHYYDMSAKNIGKTIDWQNIDVEAYGGVLHVQKNNNVLFLNVWTKDHDMTSDKWEYGDQLFDSLVDELEARGVHNVYVSAVLNPTKENAKVLDQLSQVHIQNVVVQGELTVEDQAEVIKKRTFKSELKWLLFYELFLGVLAYFRLKHNQVLSESAFSILICMFVFAISVGLFVVKARAKKAYNAYLKSQSV